MSSDDDVHDFQDSLEEGTYWEDKLQRRLQNVITCGSVEQILFEEEPEKQRAGVDLEFEFTEIETVDTKVRDHYYHQFEDLFLETWSVWPDKPGWFFTSDVDVIAYAWKNRAGTNLLNEGYLINMSDRLRDWFYDHLEVYDEVSTKSQDGDTEWETRGRVVPIDEFPEGTLFKFNPKVPTDRVTDQATFDEATDGGADE